MTTVVRVDDAPGGAAWWEAHHERLARRRPRAGGLTVERVVDEAVRLVDDHGLEALTVRRLAASLGTSSATLYRHVASVDELLVLVVDHVIGEIDLPATGTGSRDAVVELAERFRHVLLRHPEVVPTLRAAPLLGPNANEAAQRGLLLLLELGLPVDIAVPGVLSFIDFILGSVFFDTPGAAARQVDSVVSGMFELPSVDVFRFGVDTFLDGLERRA